MMYNIEHIKNKREIIIGKETIDTLGEYSNWNGIN
eukprot:UN08047